MSPGESGTTPSFSSSSPAGGHLGGESGRIRWRRACTIFDSVWGFDLDRQRGEGGRNLSNVCTGSEEGAASVSPPVGGSGGGGAGGRERSKVCAGSDAGGTRVSSPALGVEDHLSGEMYGIRRRVLEAADLVRARPLRVSSFSLTTSDA